MAKIYDNIIKKLTALDEEEKHMVFVNNYVKHSGVFDAEDEEDIHKRYEEKRKSLLTAKHLCK